jgi:hypothetical protein
MNATETAPPAPADGAAGRPGNAWAIVICALVVIGIAVRLLTMPVAPDVEDSVLFIRGVIRHSIAEMRPHWPGYAVYIWLGKLFTAAVGDPVLGLHLVSALASALTAWPLALVTRAWARSLGVAESTAEWCGWATAALWLTTPMAWVTSAQILSDPLGLLCGTTMLALCVGGRSRADWRWIVAAVLGGVMIGVRLVNITMLGPLVAEGWKRRDERWRGLPLPLILVLAIAAGVLPWLLWLAIRDPSALVYDASVHIGGHFKAWGDSMWTDHHPFTRPLRALRAISLYGLGAVPPDPRGVLVSVAWLAILLLAAARGRWRSPVSRLVGLWAWPHLLYIFIAHDVDYPRYLLTPVALLCLVGGLALLGHRPAGFAAVLVAVAGMAAVSEELALRQRRQPLVEIQMASFLAGRSPAAIAIVDHPAVRFFLEGAGDIASADTTAQAIPAWQATWTAAGREVFATEPPPQDPAGWVPVAHFCRDPRINPYLSHDMWLFAPASSALGRAGPVTACDER